MIFKKGDRVRVVECMGRDCDSYYHGGFADDVPIGTIGIVDGIISDTEIAVDFEDKCPEVGTWCVHPDEIELCSLRLKDLIKEL